MESGRGPHLLNSTSDPNALQKLEQLYTANWIAPEKKPFIVDLKASQGPYLCVGNNTFILDASSQVATMGLGFNPAEYQNLHAEIANNPKVKISEYKHFLLYQAGWSEGFVHFCHSGAEANEIALGWAFETRSNQSARKILAFEGGFHGRMLVALGATWNPKKREPYAWPGVTATFCDWPKLTLDHVSEAPPPSAWIKSWYYDGNFKLPEKSVDPFLGEEVRCLLDLSRQLQTGEFFAIILEPRQCEGGDRYGSRRFHQAVAALARRFGVALIYDEVQCGVGLGGPFYWHQLFDLKFPDGSPIHPDFVTCAKKAQVGAVLSHSKISWPEEFSEVSAVRGYLQAKRMSEARKEIGQIEAWSRSELFTLVKKYPEILVAPRCQGLSFSIDFHTPKMRDACVVERFNFGLFYFPAGEKSIRFRLNLSFRREDIRLLFSQFEKSLNRATKKITDGQSEEVADSSSDGLVGVSPPIALGSFSGNESLINKICLSNFVTETYLYELKVIIEALPPDLRHVYSASGQSECVDKIVKSIWAKRKIPRLLAFKGDFFGAGSHVSRGLSGIAKEKVFEVDFFDTVEELKACLNKNPYHSCWVEPLGQFTGAMKNLDLLKSIREFTKQAGVPLIFCETSFLKSGVNDFAKMVSQTLRPDCGYVYLGGQMGLAYLQLEHWVSKPLEIVSTWEGDAYSLHQFMGGH